MAELVGPLRVMKIAIGARPCSEDIAILSGGTPDRRGPRHQARKRHARGMLGRAKRLRIEKDTTTIIDGAGKKAEIEGLRIAQINKTQVEDTTSDYDKEKLQERLAKLAGGVAVIRVGGCDRSRGQAEERQGRRRLLQRDQGRHRQARGRECRRSGGAQLAMSCLTNRAAGTRTRAAASIASDVSRPVMSAPTNRRASSSALFPGPQPRSTTTATERSGTRRSRSRAASVRSLSNLL